MCLHFIFAYAALQSWIRRVEAGEIWSSQPDSRRILAATKSLTWRITLLQSQASGRRHFWTLACILLTLARLFLKSQPHDVLYDGQLLPAVDQTDGICSETPEGQMVCLGVDTSSKQPKRADKPSLRLWVPRADVATVRWTDDGKQEKVR